MGFAEWMMKRNTKGIVKAMSIHYRQGKAAYPNEPESEICRAVVGSRFQVPGFGPSASQRVILSRGIDDVHDLFSACALVIKAESRIDLSTDLPLASVACVTVAEEVAKILGWQSDQVLVAKKRAEVLSLLTSR